MEYYAAVVNEDEIRAACLIPPFNILCSYHYFKKKKDTVKECLKNHYSILIDSGAFSAANSNQEIDIDDYCRFIIETDVKLYAGLDVIGNAEATRRNNEYMTKEYFLNPIPTFHMGSKLTDLEKLMDYSYIALGGMVFSSGIEKHCDSVWDYILKNNPRLRVHGFGLTNVDLMKRYPWYSVDSSSFKSCKRFGRQAILWGGFDFRTLDENEFLELLAKMGFNPASNKEKWFLYDFFGAQAYKTYGSHLKELNRHRKFDFLTAQSKLF
jgi:hypothetical protein